MPTTDTPLPVQLLIFGGGGDLTRRKLIPAVARLRKAGQPSAGLEVIAIGRRAKSDQAFCAELRESLDGELAASFDELAPHIHYRSADVGWSCG